MTSCVLRSTTRVPPSRDWKLSLLLADAPNHELTWCLRLCPPRYLAGLLHGEDLVAVGIQKGQQISSRPSVEQVLARRCGDQLRVLGPAKRESADRNTHHHRSLVSCSSNLKRATRPALTCSAL